jgi:hypothetical protein
MQAGYVERMGDSFQRSGSSGCPELSATPSQCSAVPRVSSGISRARPTITQDHATESPNSHISRRTAGSAAHDHGQPGSVK